MRWGENCERAVDCPVCTADRGRRCVDENGRLLAGGPHRERWRAFNLRIRKHRARSKQRAENVARYEREGVFPR